MSTDENKLNDCGCCEEDSLRYPEHSNRPGRDAVDYRLATHAGFLRRMQAMLSRDQLTGESSLPARRPLQKLTTRSADDPAVGLLDAWATAMDVLTFYQERIANEGYIRTATERRSVLELARAIGYELNPGVAASAFLAFTAESMPGMPETVTVPSGTGVLSVPPQDKLPQTFETVEEIVARSEWNELKPITPVTPVPELIESDVTSLRLQGTSAGLKPGDAIVIVGKERTDEAGSERWDFRILESVQPIPAEGYTRITWREGLGHEYPPVDPAAVNVTVHAFRLRASVFGHNAPEWKSLDPEVKARYAPHGIEAVTSVAFSSDGTLALCSTVDSTIKLWKISTSKVVRAFSGHKGSVNSAVFSHDSKYVVSGGDDGTVRVWDPDTGGLIQTFTGHSGPVNSVACAHYQYTDPADGKTKDKKVVLSGGADSTVILWNLETWKKEYTFAGHSGAVNGVAFSSDGTKALSASTDGTIRMWDVKAGTWIRTFTGHTCAVNSVSCCLHKGTGALSVVSGGSDGTVKVWNGGTGELFRTLSGHVGAVNGVACFYSDAAKTLFIVSGGSDWTAKVWNGDTGAPPLHTLSGHTAAVTGVAFSADGKKVLSGSLDKTLKLWDAGTGSLKKTLSGDTVDYITEWPGFAIPEDPQKPSLDLDNVYPTILPGSWIALMKPSYVELYGVREAGVAWRTDFSLSAKITRLSLDTVEHLSWFGRRETVVFVESEQLELYTEQVPQKLPIEGTVVELATLEPQLERGRSLVMSGKRMRARVTDATGLSLTSSGGFSHAEPDIATGDELVAMSPPEPESADYTIEWEPRDGEFIATLKPVKDVPTPVSAVKITWHLRDRNGFEGYVSTTTVANGGTLEDAQIRLVAPLKDDEVVSEAAFIEQRLESEDRKRTVLVLTAALQNIYDHDSVTINANVARATHGETVHKEILGSGDGTLTNQRFTLKKKPLTYVSAPTPTGGETTLGMWVNDVLWSEATSLYGLNGRSQNYIVRNDNEGNSTVMFGDGTNGARLPSGQENVVAHYRSGIGPDGEVEAGSLILLQDKPLGVRSVTNPLPAAGAAAPETLDGARANAPLTVLTLDRVVSIKDFEDFAAAFAGIGKAQAVSLWNGEVSFAHITIAAENGDPVDASSDLYANLVLALNRVRDTSVQVRVDTFASRYFNVAAWVLIDPRYLWDTVEAGIRESLLTTFSFEQRAFGQQVTSAEVITAIQKVEGVEAVNLTALYYYLESPALNDPLPDEPKPARWINNQVQLAELLLLNPAVEGVVLKEMSS